MASEDFFEKGTTRQEKGLESKEPPPTLPVEVVWTRKDDTYEVQGGTLEEVWQFLKSRGREPAIINFEMDYELEPDDRGNVRKVTLRPNYGVTIPVWPEATEQVQEVRDSWASYLNNLQCHENDHVFILEDCVKRLVYELSATKNRRVGHVKAKIKDAMEVHKGEQKAFDTVSKYGTIDYGFCKAAVLRW